MLNLTNPKYFVPIHGESRHLHAHAATARSVGIAKESIFMLENGDCLEISDSGVRMGTKVDAGIVYVDGLGVGDVGSVVLRDRQLLARDGIATVVIAIDASSGKVLGDIELIMRGVTVSEGDHLLVEARARITKTLEKTAKATVVDKAVIASAVRESLSQFLWEQVRRRPMIIPVVVEA